MSMKRMIAAALLATAIPAVSHAAISFDQNVTSAVIFGSGNVNGAFTVDRQNGIELGLRGKLRFNSSNQPENTFNSNGDGSYSFDAGLPPTGFSWTPGDTSTPVWSFEWSVNANYDGSGNVLNAFDYYLSFDGDPSAAADSDGFDPINVPYADHGIGTNATGNGGGAKASGGAEYAALIAASNLAQNSWNYEFFDDASDAVTISALSGFDARVSGLYTITLSAFEKGTQNQMASTSIDIRVGAVPLPASLTLLLAGVGGLGLMARRRKQAPSA